MGTCGWGYGSWGDPTGDFKWYVNGFLQPCSLAARILSNGGGTIAPLGEQAAWRTTDGGKTWNPVFWERDSQGQWGYETWSEAEGVEEGEIGGWNVGWHRLALSLQVKQNYYTPTSKELRDRLEVTVTDKNCKTFLDKVRDSLGIDKTFQELLKDALNELFHLSYPILTLYRLSESIECYLWKQKKVP